MVPRGDDARWGTPVPESSIHGESQFWILGGRAFGYGSWALVRPLWFGAMGMRLATRLGLSSLRAS